jgi:ATP-dependent DNA helicase DinG
VEVQEALARVVRALPGGGEARPGQAAMADAVADAIARRRHLVVQAGTGTGKSLGYLVPAILSGRKVVVATATRALQDQLAGKDLPFLSRHLGRRFRFAVLKGRTNYLCRQRAVEVAGGGDQLSLDEVEEPEARSGGARRKGDELGVLGLQVQRLLAWSRTSKSGDRAELDFEPRPRAWATLSVSSRECPGRARCPSGEECFAEAARDAAADAHVVVVNTHLYATHLASGGNVLPEHDVVVFDEAHELEDVAAASLGFELGAGRLRALAYAVRAVAGTAQAGLVQELLEAGSGMEGAMAPWRGRRLPQALDPAVADALAYAGQRLTKVSSALRRQDRDDVAAVRSRAQQAAGHLAGDLAAALELRETDVAWVEGPPGAPVLKVAPVDVGELLAELLWDDVTAVLTSATVPPRIAARLSMPSERVDELDVASPFPFATHALLYCAAHLPDPRSPGYEAAMIEELGELVGAAGGRTLALFTSWRAMHAAADALRDALPFTVLTQADLPKPALLTAFAAEESSCLFATMGFWQGVDVPGPSLSLVAIDRIPFPRPDEPLVQARRDRAGPAAFRSVDLPRAATLLAQGAGRLIRSAEDRGVVAVLDPRLASASYRWDLVRALPPMTRTRHRADAMAFLAGLRSPSVSNPGAPGPEGGAASPCPP